VLHSSAAKKSAGDLYLNQFFYEKNKKNEKKKKELQFLDEFVLG
jgi:hypothetical protein